LDVCLCHIIYNVPEKEVKDSTLLVQQNKIKEKKKAKQTERATYFQASINTP
jgi:hypothetical protein